MFQPKLRKTIHMEEEENRKNKEYDLLKNIGDLNLDFSFLKQILPEDNADYASIELKEKEDKKNVLVLLNSLKTIAPLLKKSLSYSNDKKKQTEYILKLNDIVIKQAKKFTEKLLGLNPEDKNNTWIINVLSNFFHSAIPDELMYEEITEDYFSDTLLKALFYISNENSDENKLSYFPDTPLSVGVQLSLIKTLVPIINAQNYYDFYRNKTEDLKFIISEIIKNCSQSMIELVPASTTEKDKVMLFKLLLEESALLFVDCWYNTAYKTIQYLKKENMTTKEIKDKYPNGIPIDKILQNYNHNHKSLISLVKLVK